MLNRALQFLHITMFLTVMMFCIEITHAAEEDLFTFDFAGNIRMNDADSTKVFSPITIEAKEQISGIEALEIHIPLEIRAIFSSDFSDVTVSGTAQENGKVEPLSKDNLSLDQRTLTISLNGDLSKAEKISISGLILKAFQQDNSAKPIQLKYQYQGSEFVQSSNQTIRLDTPISGRRRFNVPEPIREIEIVDVSPDSATVIWTPSPDLNLLRYQVILERDPPVINESSAFEVPKTENSLLLNKLSEAQQYKINIKVINEGGLYREKTASFTTLKTAGNETNQDLFDWYANVFEDELVFEEEKGVLYSEVISSLNQLFSDDPRDRFISRRLRRYERRAMRKLTNRELVRIMVMAARIKRLEFKTPINNDPLDEGDILKAMHVRRQNMLGSYGLIDGIEDLSEMMSNTTTKSFYRLLYNFHQEISK